MQVATLPFQEESITFGKDTITLSLAEYKDLASQALQGNYWKTRCIEACQEKDSLLIENKTLRAQVSILEARANRLKVQVSRLKAQHKSDCERNKKLSKTNQEFKAEIEEKKGVIRGQKQQLFGKKSEKGASKSEANFNTAKTGKKRRRGQQKGTRGHGRTKNPDLLVVTEHRAVFETACKDCGKEYDLLPPEESKSIEMPLFAYILHVILQRYAKNCTCGVGKKIITAERAQRVYRNCPFGISVLVDLLLQKFLYAQPINRILNSFLSLGLMISPGTIAGSLKKIAPLFIPVYEALYNKQMTESVCHNDESFWKVFEQMAEKVGHNCYLWLVRSLSVIYFEIDPTRSADVPLRHYANMACKKVIVVCDRYSAYFKLARLYSFIILAFCWAHVRRDFLKIANNHPHLADWAFKWRDMIAKIYQLNKERLLEWKADVPLSQQSSLFKEKHTNLETALNEIKSLCDTLFEADKKAKKEKAGERLHPSQHKALKSLRRCWDGLTVFLEYPQTSMDNNPAERSIRNPVIGRKNYYGSGSLWSADLAAMMFSILQTILLWKINPRTWLTLYLEACAQNKGNPPENMDEFLPWKMSEARKDQLQKPLPKKTS